MHEFDPIDRGLGDDAGSMAEHPDVEFAFTGDEDGSNRETYSDTTNHWADRSIEDMAPNPMETEAPDETLNPPDREAADISESEKFAAQGGAAAVYSPSGEWRTVDTTSASNTWRIPYGANPSGVDPLPVTPEGYMHKDREIDTHGQWSDAPSEQVRSHIYAPADTVAVGENGPVLNGGSEGCRVVTIYHPASKTGTLVHIDAAGLDDNVGEQLLEEVADRYPDLFSEESEAQVFGDVAETLLDEYADDPDSHPAEEWNERLATRLADMGITRIDVVSEGRGKEVTLDTATGRVIARDDTGRVVYPPFAYSASGEEDIDIAPPVLTADENLAATRPEAPPDIESVARDLLPDYSPGSEPAVDRILNTYADALDTETIEDEAALLSQLLPEGPEGLRIWAGMLQEEHPLLEDLDADTKERMTVECIESAISDESVDPQTASRLAELIDQIGRIAARRIYDERRNLKD